MRKNLWMLAAILICGETMMLTSCSENDNITTPSDEEYKIVVEEGMTMPVNEFVNVPAVDGDQNVINTLKAIDGVTDVKAFQLNDRWDYYNEKMITKTAYYFNYKQLVDHSDPSKGWFKQQCVLTVAGQDRPTVLHTEGYALKSDKNHLQNIGEPALVPVLDANCLQVEHRYHGWSLPEGYTNKWNYLNTKQQSDDLHAIVTAIKQSGVVGNGKWLSTGVSKNGMTTAFYAYHYPNDMDAYVPFCAPFMTDLDDKRPYSYILTADAFGENQERMDKVKAAFRTYVSDKNLQAECVKVFKVVFKDYALPQDEEIRLSLLRGLFSFYYAKMSYVAYKRWEEMIPEAGDPATKYFNFIMADGESEYPGETAEQYNRRRDYVDDFEPYNYQYQYTPHALTRALSVTRHSPYFVQVCIDLGNYTHVLDWVDDLLTDDERKAILIDSTPATYGVTYDNGKFMKEFLGGMKQSTCNMMFVYGMQDPWTGAQIPDDNLGVNSRKLFIQQPYSYSMAGLHNDAIDQWNSSERNELFKWLASQGFAL